MIERKERNYKAGNLWKFCRFKKGMKKGKRNSKYEKMNKEIRNRKEKKKGKEPVGKLKDGPL